MIICHEASSMRVLRSTRLRPVALGPGPRASGRGTRPRRRSHQRLSSTLATAAARDPGENDDQYSSEVDLPFGINFFGQDYEHLWVNNNGNVTFDGPLSARTRRSA